MNLTKESEIYLVEMMLRNLSETVLISLLVEAAGLIQESGGLSDTDARRVSKLVTETLKPDVRAA